MAEHIRTVIYINGVRFFPRSLSFSAQQGDTGSFSVEVPAVPNWEALQPRAHGAVFFEDPVTRRWRLLCEGDYVGYARSKSGDGSISRALQFRGLHAVWDTVPYGVLSTLFTPIPGGAGDNEVSRMLTAVANGIRVAPSNDPKFNVFSLQDFVERQTTPGTRISAFMRSFIQACMSQAPADVFYYEARRVFDKSYALRDDAIGTMVDFARIRDFSANGFQSLGVNFNTPLRRIIEAYEDLAMYQHLTIPSPPRFSDPTTDTLTCIMELLYAPHLYNVVPPACNVIFADQCTMEQVSRNFNQEPTRIIGQLTGVAGSALPFYYLANNPEGSASSVRQLLNPDMDPRGGMTHDFLSWEELVRGVRPQFIPVGLHKLGQTIEEKGSPQLDHYMNLATRHHYEMERGRMHSITLNCSFLPYLVPGFPCLVESPQGPLYGILANVTHMISQEGAQTSVTINHVREVYVDSEQDRSPTYPTWLNRAFLPGRGDNQKVQPGIDETYKKILGPNWKSVVEGGQAFAAMVPQSRIVTKPSLGGSVFGGTTDRPDPPTSFNAHTVDLDELASFVVPVRKYSRNGTGTPAKPPGTTYAEQLRANPSQAQHNMLRYQFRPGTSLKDYVRFHGISDPVALNDSASADPPADLSGGEPLQIFGIPHGMRFIGQGDGQVRESGGTVYGVYELERRGSTYYSDARQRVARSIQGAIDRRLSRG